MTHAFQATTPSRDANAMLALTVVLILTTWSFFGRFSLVAATAGIGTERVAALGGISGIRRPSRRRRAGGRRC